MKTILRSHFNPIKMTVIYKNQTNAGEDVGKRNPYTFDSGNVNYTATVENVFVCLLVL
jgi:hypothetical protein